jgi:hypothetical protein
MAFAAPIAHAAAQPALVVVIVIDQFRHDYLERFRGLFVEDGFNRLLKGGADFAACHYRHSITKTAPGHALILSGVHANVNGIIANDWIDRESLKRLNCVDDETVRPLGAMELRGAKIPGTTALIACSPRNFLATTVGDELKIARAGRPKVISISSKDRSAVLLGGKLADAAYWMQEGRMISSSYYMADLPAWVKTFNAAGRVESYFHKTWDRLLPEPVYNEIQGPDKADGEFAGLGLSPVFPKRLDAGADTITPAFYDGFEHTPFKSEVMMEFVEAVMENENLGQRGSTDVLCVSFSVNDTIGHDMGPDSHEVMDITLRTDRMLSHLFGYLERRIGLQNCTIVLTADHGAAPLPERLKAVRPQMDAGRLSAAMILEPCEAALNRAFGKLADQSRWLIIDSSWLLIAPAALQEKKITRFAAEEVIRTALLSIEQVQSVYTRTQLETGDAPGHYGAAALLSFNRERSGDVFYQAKPFWFDRQKSGTTHGSPYNYDTHVPLLWYGVGVTPGLRTDRVGVDDIAPTLAHILRVTPPPQSTGRILF